MLQNDKAKYRHMKKARRLFLSPKSTQKNKSADRIPEKRQQHNAYHDIAENVSKCTVKQQKKYADCQNRPKSAAFEGFFLLVHNCMLQKIQEAIAGKPRYFRHIEGPGGLREQQQKKRPVQSSQSKTAIKARQKKARLPAIPPVHDAGKDAAEKTHKKLKQIIDKFNHPHPPARHHLPGRSRPVCEGRGKEE